MMESHLEVASLRRVTAAFLCVVLCSVLCGCGNDPEDVYLCLSDYRGTCQVNMGDNAYTLELEIGQASQFSARFTQPASMAGLEVHATGEAFVMVYQGMEWKATESEFPDTSVVMALRNVFFVAAQAGNLPKRNGDGYLLEGGSDSGDYTLSFTSDGAPATLSIPALSFSAVFTKTL